MSSKRPPLSSLQVAYLTVGVVVGLWLLFWGFIFYTRGDLGRMIAGSRAPKVDYWLAIDPGSLSKGSHVELLFPVPTLDGEPVPGLEQALRSVAVPVSVVQNERGVFFRLTEESLGKPGAYSGLRLSVPLDRSDVGILSKGRFLLSSETREDPGQCWVYLKADVPIKSVSLIYNVGPPGGTSVRYFWLKLENPDVTAGWMLVKGEVDP